MKTYNLKHISQSASYAVLASCTVLSLLLATFFIAEPVISHGAATDTAEFYVRQTVTAENSFLVDPTNITMVGTVSGLTGGQATGSTQFVVQSNNTSGYYVEISFENNAGAHAMYGDSTNSEALRDYDVTGEPSYGYTASTAAQFAYTVTSSSSGDTDGSFLNDGISSCNAGGTQTANHCWKQPTVAGFRIVDTITSAPTGATSTVTFNVTAPSGVVPVPVSDTYTATATLSLFSK